MHINRNENLCMCLLWVKIMCSSTGNCQVIGNYSLGAAGPPWCQKLLDSSFPRHLPCEEQVQSMKPSLQYLLVATGDCATSPACLSKHHIGNSCKIVPWVFIWIWGGVGGVGKSHLAIIWAYLAKYLLMYLTLSTFSNPPLVRQHISASKHILKHFAL